MSEARTVWQDLAGRRTAEASRRRSGMLLGVCLLLAMCAAEVAFLRYVASPETVAAVTAAEGLPVGSE
jgi:hypothetical protein